MRLAKSGILSLLSAGVALSLAGCGGSGSTDTVQNSELTQMNDIGEIEGTINDAGAMDAATSTNIALPEAPENSATENEADKEAEPANKSE